MSDEKLPDCFPASWKTGKKDKFVVEKAVAEELPPGWTKELRVRKKGSKIRKDPYYTDPATGYIFRSLKDVQRYLKTGDLGRLAFKPKDNSCDDMELEDEKLPMNAGADEEKLVDSGTNGQMTEDQSSKLVETQKDDQVVESTSTTDNLCISENASEPCKENAAVINVNVPEANGSEEREEKIKPTKEMLVPTPLIETSAENQPIENGLEERGNNQLKRNKSSSKKAGLPRRASKRLAGIEVDLPAEPKTRCQVTAKRARAAETSTSDLVTSKEHDVKAEVGSPLYEKQSTLEENVVEVEKDSKLKERQESRIVLPPASRSTTEEYGKNAHTGNKRSEKQEMPIYLPPANLSTPDEHGGKVEKDNKPNEEQELPTLFPSSNNISTPKEHDGDVQTDDNLPKEEHVAKIEMYNNPSAKQELPIVSPPASLSKPVQYGCSKVETDNNKPYEKQELPGGIKTHNEADVIKPDSPMNLSLTDLWTDPCIEFAVKTLTGVIPIGEDNNKAFDPASPLDLPLGELWTDPCIEFAVKTLTGAIPVGGDLCIQDYFQLSSSSSETRGENSFTSPDVGLNNFCQTDHFDTTDNSLHKQVSLKNLGNSALQHHVKGRSGDCSRPTFF